MAKRERTRLEKWVRVLFALLLIVLLVLAGYSQYVNKTFFPEKAMAGVLTPIKQVFSGVTDYVVNYMATLKLRGNIEAEYNKLRAENEQLMYRALFAEDLQQRVDYLEDLLGEYNKDIGSNPLHARVIEREPGNWFSEFTLDKGSRDGVKTNMAVVSKTGSMVGNVVEVYRTSCKVITLIDSNFKIGGRLVSSRYEGVVRGTLGIDGQALCRMYYLPASSVPRPGDTVVTSGVGLQFPKGLVLGTVRESTRQIEENKYYIVVEPAADFQRIEDVLILRYEPNIEVRPVGEETNQQQIVSPPTPWPKPDMPSGNETTAQPLPNAPGRTGPTPTPPPMVVHEDEQPVDVTAEPSAGPTEQADTP